MITVITPWRNHPELIADYRMAVAAWAVNNGADWGRRLVEVCIVDNSDMPMPALQQLAFDTDGLLLPGAPAMSFAESNNYGFRHTRGDVVLFLNNDITAPAGWLSQVLRDVRPGGLYAPSRLSTQIDALPVVYLEGWCIAATRDTWMDLGGWDQAYPGGYWEDTDLCFRAVAAGMKLYRTVWPVKHLGNTTAKDTPGAYAHSQPNFELFQARVRAARLQAVAA